MSYYRDQLEAWLKAITVQGGRVLDIGGGEKPLPSRLKRFEPGEYLIADNDANFKPDVFMDLNAKHAFEDNQFDIVFCLEVMEYIFNPVQAHDNIFGLLKPGGVAYISYPTIYPLHNPPGIDYLRYSKNAVEKLLEHSGFERWEITPRIATTGLETLGRFFREEGMHPMKDKQIFDIGYMVKVYKGLPDGGDTNG